MRQVGAQAMPFQETLAGIAVHDVEYKSTMPASVLGCRRTRLGATPTRSQRSVEDKPDVCLAVVRKPG